MKNYADHVIQRFFFFKFLFLFLFCLFVLFCFVFLFVCFLFVCLFCFVYFPFLFILFVFYKAFQESALHIFCNSYFTVIIDCLKQVININLMTIWRNTPFTYQVGSSATRIPLRYVFYFGVCVFVTQVWVCCCYVQFSFGKTIKWYITI